MKEYPTLSGLGKGAIFSDFDEEGKSIRCDGYVSHHMSACKNGYSWNKSGIYCFSAKKTKIECIICVTSYVACHMDLPMTVVRNIVRKITASGKQGVFESFNILILLKQ